MKRRWLLIGALVVAVGSSACSSASAPVPGKPRLTDVNPRDPATLVDGKFVWPLDFWDPNWNYNEVDGADVVQPNIFEGYLPRLFSIQPDGTPAIDHDYLISARVTSTSPQTVTYDLNPKATWSNGDPLIWSDLKTQWQALNGTNPAFQVQQTTGYADIASITPGSSPKQAVVTFTRPFADWPYLFSAYSPLYPPSVNATPEAFNTSLANGPTTISAGPFVVSSADKNKGTVVLTRNPRWWGVNPVLSRIVFQVVSRANRADALANGEISLTSLSSDPNLYQRAKTMPNVAIRESISNAYNDFLLNGRPGTILADQKLRTALVTGIDGTEMAKADIGSFEPNPAPLGNHLYLPGTRYFADHSAINAYDPAKAAAELDADGWKRNGQYRAKNGKELDLTILAVSDTGDTGYANDLRLITSQLATLGVHATTNSVPLASYSAPLDNGQWDLVPYGQVVPPFPISGMQTLFFLDRANLGQNYGGIGSTQVNQEFNQASATLDPGKQAELGNRIDTELARLAIDIGEDYAPGIVLADKNLANFGAFGVADVDYTKIGFVRP